LKSVRLWFETSQSKKILPTSNMSFLYFPFGSPVALFLMPLACWMAQVC
jgi:hypothetical protein